MTAYPFSERADIDRIEGGIMLQRSVTPLLLAAALFVTPALVSKSLAQENQEPWLPSLMTETPAEGFDLAITMARKAVTTTQTDKDTLHKLRPNYSHDPDSL